MKSCQNLKYQSISGPKLTDNHFKDIKLYLPQLKSIAIESNSGITDKTLNYFAKLLNSCPNIHNITFNCNTKLTQLSVKLFKGIANKNPKIDYNFYFRSINKIKYDEEEDYLQIPGNLSLKYFYINGNQ